MDNLFIDNERKTNRLIINIYWVISVFGFLGFFMDKTFGLNDNLLKERLFLGIAFIILLGILLEVNYFMINTREKIKTYPKYLIFLALSIILFYFNYIYQDLYMLGLYCCIFIAAIFYYDISFFTFSIIINLFFIGLLVFIKYPEVNIKILKEMQYSDMFLIICLYMFLLLVCFTKSRKIIKTLMTEENKLTKSNSELSKAYDELNLKQQEILNLNQQLTDSNESLQETYVDLYIKQEMELSLNQELTESNEKLERVNQELSANQEEMIALNQQLIASNESLQETYVDLYIKQEMEVSLNQALTESNEKLEKAYQELSVNQEELFSTNENLEKAYNELKQAQIQLVQQEKMASLGQLVAGIAHEINSPMGAISCNTEVLEKLISTIRLHISDSENQIVQGLLSKLNEINKVNMMAGERIAKIVKSLRIFARLDDEDTYLETDIHKDIDNILILLKNRLGNRIEIIKEYGEIPKIGCFASQLNQVIMNLIVNSAEAIQDCGKIWIKTRGEGDTVQLIIRDNGIGIKPEHIEKIFNPGFTTKGVGVGTGLSLAISYDIIQRHNGYISVKSEYGKGTEITIQLPIQNFKINQ